MTLKGVWIDESDKTQCGPLYSQCVTRTMTTNGFVIQTFTPENGVDEVVKKFLDAEAEGSNQLSLHIASMYDAHINVGGHITDEMIEKIKAGCPEFEWDCRINGIPSAGSGAVFPLKDSDIVENFDIVPEDHWNICASFDLGKVVDPTVISYITKDPSTNITYLFKQDYLDGGIYDKDARAAANAILSSPYPHVVVVPSHDSGLNSSSPESFAKLLQGYGVNVHYDCFRNPTDTELLPNLNQTARSGARNIEPGLQMMRKMFKEGMLKVTSSCTEWFKEKQTYFYTDKGIPVDKNNHCIDSSRYGVMSFIGDIYVSVLEAKTGRSDGWKRLQPRLRA